MTVNAPQLLEHLHEAGRFVVLQLVRVQQAHGVRDTLPASGVGVKSAAGTSVYGWWQAEW